MLRKMFAYQSDHLRPRAAAAAQPYSLQRWAAFAAFATGARAPALPWLALAALAGNAALQLVPELPAAHWRWLLAPAALLLCRPRLRLAGAFALGFLWTLGAAHARLAELLPEELAGRDHRLLVRVVSLPAWRGGALRFRAERLAPQDARLPRLVQLSAYDDPARPLAADEFKLGDVAEVTARLKRPRSYRNPGSLDYERSLFAAGVGATGYVKRWRVAPRGRAPLRQRIYDRLTEPRFRNGAALAALALGARGGMDPARYARLIETGVNHLFAISGLHIGMVFGLGFWCARALWSRRPQAGLALRDFACLAALPGACAYAWLAGFSVPTQRALIMLACLTAAGLARRPAGAARVLALALVAVLAARPLSTLSASFWFSFGAVAVIVTLSRALPRRPRALFWGALQVCLSLVMLCLTLTVFGLAAPLAPLINCVAVPFVGLLLLPCCLLAAAGAALGDWHAPFAHCADLLFALFWTGLDFVVAHGGGGRHHAPPWWAGLCAAAGLALAATAVRWRARLLAALCFAPLLFDGAGAPRPGGFDVVFLDVGQGLSVFVRTHRRALLYDAGPRHRSGFDLGAAVVAPFLRSQNIRRLDALVLSHDDSDHAGGAAAILAGFAPAAKWTSRAARRPGFRACRAGQGWSWDGVRFEFLHPAQGDDFSGNNGSCVLRVAAAGGAALLLTGDIEAPAERALLARAGAQLEAAVLLAPHHGSATSSGPAFVARVGPRLAVAAAGHRNRFGVPPPAVRRRYAAHGARLLVAADTGALTVRFPARGRPRLRGAFRYDRKRYWHDARQPPPAGGELHVRDDESTIDPSDVPASARLLARPSAQTGGGGRRPRAVRHQRHGLYRADQAADR